MTRAWHIARKDARLQRWTLIAWVFVLLVTISSRLIAPQVRDDPAWRMAMPLWFIVTLFGYVPIWIASIANTIQSDRLVGSTAFWLTRPIAPDTLLGGKLLGLFTFVLLPSLIIDAMVMAAYRVSPGVILAALLQEAWMLAVITLVFAFLSAVTTTVVRVLIILAVAFTIEVVALQIQMVMAQRRMGGGGIGFVSIGLWFGFTEPNAVLFGWSIFAIGVLIAIAYQYRYRRRARAIALFVAAVGAPWLLQGVWGHIPLIREPSVEHESWTRDVRPQLRTVDLANGRPLTADMSTIVLGDRTQIAAPVMLNGLPAGYVATPILQHAELTFDDHSRMGSLTDTTSGEVVIRVGRSFASDREISVKAHTERWATLFDIEEEALRRNGDRPATYIGTFDFVIERSTPIATLPVAVGATASDGARSVTVSGTRFESSGCTMRLTTTEVRLVTRAPEWPDLVLRYTYRDGREMADPYAPIRNNPRVFLGPRYVASPLGLLAAFDLNVRTAYPVLRDDARDHPSDAVHAACSDITMSVASVSYAGRLRRTLELHDFRLNDPFAAR